MTALEGLRVVELCGEHGAWAGKLLADMGAEVIKVEPPSGDPTRQYAPFAEDVPDRERSLWFWHYNTSKQGVTLDLEQAQGRELFKRLVEGADLLIENERPGRLATLGLDYVDLQPLNPRLIMVSVTPFGRSGPRSEEEATDLTLLAGGGPAWSCGYDDHSLPPVRGGGNQGYQTACHFAVMSALTALLYRHRTGEGQHIDVNSHAASNVSTENGSMFWLVSQETVQRQTGRHASVQPTVGRQILCQDGRYVTTGFPPQRPDQFKALYDWMVELGIADEFEQTPILELAIQGRSVRIPDLEHDQEARAKYTAGIEGMRFVASRITAFDYFHGGQQRGFQCGIIYSPEEVLEDPHFVARGFPVEVEHPELGRSFQYPGAPYQFSKTPWRIRRRAPLLGEDNAEVYGALGVTAEELAALQSEGVV